MIDFGDEQVKRMGFVTRKDVSQLGVSGMVAVYCPHSYNFSGNLYFVPAENIQPIELDSTDAMKYIVSGGITNLEAEGND